MTKADSISSTSASVGQHLGRHVTLTKIEYQEEHHGFVVQLCTEAGVQLTYTIATHDLFDAIRKATEAINRDLTPVLADIGV